MPTVTANLSVFSKLPALPKNARGIQLKLDRANKHIEELRVVLESFYATKPYRIAVKKDIRTRQEVFYVSKIVDVPKDVSIIAGDALQNIRSALDHLAIRLYAITHQGKAEDVVYFPIAKSAATYNSTGFRGKV